MRKPLVAGNWKMNNTVFGARQLISELAPNLHTLQDVDVVICPPFTALLTAAALLQGTSIKLGAQNMHWERAGAYTGEISAEMVEEFCEFVILGHSERRKFMHETDESVNKKVITALSHNLIPIVCVGETLEENETGKTRSVVAYQIKECLKNLDNTFQREKIFSMIIAYEPVWAIGTGRAAKVSDAEAVIKGVIRPELESMFGSDMAQSVRVLYGGSVSPANASEFFSNVEIDGGLIGGASIKAVDFLQIVKATSSD